MSSVDLPTRPSMSMPPAADPTITMLFEVIGVGAGVGGAVGGLGPGPGVGVPGAGAGEGAPGGKGLGGEGVSA